MKLQFRGWVYRAYRKSQNLTHMPNLGKRNGHFTPFSTIRLRFAPAAVGVCVSYLTFQTTNGFPLVLPENHQYVYLIFPNNCYFARSFPNQPCLITGRCSTTLNMCTNSSVISIDNIGMENGLQTFQRFILYAIGHFMLSQSISDARYADKNRQKHRTN